MAKRFIRTDDDAILRKKSKPVPSITPRVLQLLDDMLETLDEADGVGLAAPQVGILRRVVIIRPPDGDVLYEMINPRVVLAEGSQVKNEACLSLPGKSGWVERPERVSVEYTDRSGGARVLEGEGLMAVIASHELDHLDGVLYTDKLTEKPGDAVDDGSP